MLDHTYGCTSLFGGHLAFFYGAPILNGPIANCHYGISVWAFFIGVVFATDAGAFEIVDTDEE